MFIAVHQKNNSHTNSQAILQRISLTLLIFIAFCMPAYSLMAPSSVSAAPAPTGLKVSGNKFVNGSNHVIRFAGMNHSGSEYACSQNWGFFDGSSNLTVSDATIQAMKTWGVNAVRVPLNEHCWLDINSAINEEWRGSEYRQAITDYVNKLTAQGIAPVLELHFHAPGTRQTENNPMPNRDHSPAFWTSVANQFKGNTSVIFELVNEPYPDGNRDTSEAWRCWRDGGSCAGVVDRVTGAPYVAAGMQELVTAVRGTGATNLILLGGLRYSNTLSRWEEHKPNDPLNNTAPAWHVYNFNGCNTAACFEAEVKPLALQYPIFATEFGPEEVCDQNFHCELTSTSFHDDLFPFFTSHGISVAPWTWNMWMTDHQRLIADWNGTPNGTWGTTAKNFLTAIANENSGSDTQAPTIKIVTNQNTVVSGTVGVGSHVSDNVGVVRVRYSISGNGYTNHLLVDTTNPGWGFAFPFNTTTFPNGTYQVKAEAFDAAGNKGVSPNTQIIIYNSSNGVDTTAPTIAIASASPRTVSGTLGVGSSPTQDNVGIARVRYYLSGNGYTNHLLANTTDPVWGYAFLFNTALFPNGTYTLRAQAVDPAGNVGSSQNVTMIINNPVDPKPAVTITNPANGASVTGTTTIRATGTDDVQVTWMELHINGMRVATSNNNEVTHAWTPAAAGQYTIVAKSFDADGNWAETQVVVTKP